MLKVVTKFVISSELSRTLADLAGVGVVVAVGRPMTLTVIEGVMPFGKVMISCEPIGNASLVVKLTQTKDSYCTVDTRGVKKASRIVPGCRSLASKYFSALPTFKSICSSLKISITTKHLSTAIGVLISLINKPPVGYLPRLFISLHPLKVNTLPV